jgi:predicted RNA binding protein YcfA (HicA-like mRNA interferase family)
MSIRNRADFHPTVQITATGIIESVAVFVLKRVKGSTKHLEKERMNMVVATTTPNKFLPLHTGVRINKQAAFAYKNLFDG